MKNNELQELYKEFYFHELDVREKITTRTQVMFALYATVLTIIAYMMKTLDISTASILIKLFYIFLIISVLPFIISIYYTIRAFWGNTYLAVASPNKIEDFIKEALEHEEAIKDYNLNEEVEEKNRI